MITATNRKWCTANESLLERKTNRVGVKQLRNGIMSKTKQRAEYMTAEQKKAMGNLPRTHQNCKEKTKVCRPGKTAKDRDKGAVK